ncbi:hypothetical protein TrispH2_003203 [Trichoplax sp. H2]|nr:hypothetical protein TrispH2_003203 [Trichoplax sp. H2]|eukprot:RDD45006.1 hypothetical protein TrispH2_003203 [Trichoplax sp. H2]
MVLPRVIEEKSHIEKLFRQRAQNDTNSTTLANTLEKDIQTVFNSPEKFVMELLQNADDASCGDTSVDVRFRFYNGYLAFSHNGKHFDEEDVEAICDNAQQNLHSKRLNINKTGYKGIGFKSVFIIADCTYIISRNYCFRFDRDYTNWKESDSDENRAGRYPWQIIPIWTEPCDVPKILQLNPADVNFLFRLRSNNDVIVSALNILSNTPRTMLFLRHIQNIVIDNHGSITCINRRNELTSQQRYDLYLNNVLKSSWHVMAYSVNIPKTVLAQLQAMGPQECPEKLKKAKNIEIKFAINIDPVENTKLNALDKNANLFCYLPTLVNCGLPFLVNTDFLLTADRMQLLSNAWNNFLFESIGKLHITSLAEMVQFPGFRDDILALFTRRLQSYTQQQFINAYDKGLLSEMRNVAFVPSNTDDSRLLKYNDAIADSTGFFKIFPGIDPPVEHRLINYNLSNVNKLQHQFTLYELSTIIEKYAAKSTSLQFHRKLLTFLMQQFVGPDNLARASLGNIQHCLSGKRILLAANFKLISSDIAYFPTKNHLQIYPKFLNIEAIHPKLLHVRGLRTWLRMVGVKELNDVNLILEIENIVRNNMEKFKIELSMEIVTLLCNIDTSLISGDSILNCLPLLTKDGSMISAKYCFLPSLLYPDVDIEEIIQTDVGFVSERYCLLNTTEKLRKTLLDLGVQQNLQLCLQSPVNLVDKNRIDCFKDYYEHLVQNDQADVLIVSQVNLAYMPLMRCLSHEDYAEHFFRQLMEQENAVIENLKDFKVKVRSSRQRNDCPIPSYLAFMLSFTQCIQANDGKLYKMSELSTLTLRKRLGKHLAGLLPQMKCDLGQSVIKLSDDLMLLLGARDILAIENAVKLLQVAAMDSSPKQQKYFKRIYLAMIKSSYTADEQKYLRHQNILLLASDNSLQDFKSLYFICGDDFDISHNKKLIKSMPGLTSDAMLVICRYFKIREIKLDDLQIKYRKAKVNTNLKRDIVNLFKLTASIEEDVESDKVAMNSKWIDKLTKIDFVAVEELVLVYSSTSKICFEARAFLHNGRLSYERSCPRYMRRILDILVNHFDLSVEATSLLFELASMTTQADRLDWLEDNGYDIRKLNYIEKDECRSSSRRKKSNSLQSKEGFDGNSNSPSIQGLNRTPAMDTGCAVAAMITKRRNRMQSDVSNGMIRPKEFVIKLRNDQALFANSSNGNTDALTNMNDSESQIFSSDHDIGSPNGLSSVQGTVASKASDLSLDRGNNKMSLSKKYFSSVLELMNRKAKLPRKRKHDELDLSTEGHSLGNHCFVNEEGYEIRNESVTEDHESAQWGVEFLFYYLQVHYRGKYPTCSYEETDEGFLLKGVDEYNKMLSLKVNCHGLKSNSKDRPVDIEIIKNNSKRFIKVKSTTKDGDMIIKISRNEWKFMRASGSRYQLFCVYGIRQLDKVRIEKIEDPASKFFSNDLVPLEICIKV